MCTALGVRERCMWEGGRKVLSIEVEVVMMMMLRRSTSGFAQRLRSTHVACDTIKYPFNRSMTSRLLQFRYLGANDPGCQARQTRQIVFKTLNLLDFCAAEDNLRLRHIPASPHDIRSCHPGSVHNSPTGLPLDSTSTRIPPLDLLNNLPQTPDHPNALPLQLLDVLRLPFGAFGPFAWTA